MYREVYKEIEDSGRKKIKDREKRQNGGRITNGLCS